MSGDEITDREWSFTCSRLDCQLHAGMHGPFRSEADALTASDSLRCPREHEFLWRCVIPWTRPQAHEHTFRLRCTCGVTIERGPEDPNLEAWYADMADKQQSDSSDPA